MIPDPETVTINIFKTCSVPNFTQFIDVLVTNAKLNNITLTYEYIMTHSEDKYRDMVLNKEWDHHHSGSSFYNGKPKQQGSSVKQQQKSSPSSNSTDTPSDFSHPKLGEPEVKLIRGNEWKFCSICRRWRRNQAAHTTSEHVVNKNGNNPPSTTVAPPSPVSPKPAPDPSKTQFQRNPVFQQARNVTFIGGL